MLLKEIFIIIKYQNEKKKAAGNVIPGPGKVNWTMPRPVKRRRIENIPEINYFKPIGIPRNQLEENVLSLEEIEAVRLKDVEGLEQAEAAARMEVSRPTYQRILGEARGKIADALLNGKALRFEGGNYDVVKAGYLCSTCGTSYEVPLQNEAVCPDCRIPFEPGRGRGRRGRRNGK